MRDTRTDLWLPIGDAMYRLCLGYQQLCELENLMDSGVGRLWGSLMPVDGPDDGARAPASHYMHALRLALTGGGIGVRNGGSFPVSPNLATSVAEATAAGPVIVLIRIVRALLAVCGHGRPATPEEVAAFSIPPGPPLIPTWALEHRA